MVVTRVNYIKILLLTIALLSFVCNQTYSQEKSITKIDCSALKQNLRVLASEQPGSTILYKLNYRDRNTVFLDSLKEKASKRKLTRKLYEIMVVSPDISVKKSVSGKSESQYYGFSGRKIRKIDVTRLSVFGSDIDNPASYREYKAQNLLNKTHVNTLDPVIRNNLLFEAGDTLSPILLSDNERLLRELSFIDDARINVIPVSEEEVDIQVITKDVYSLGGEYSPSGLTRGKVSIFENNIFGLGHELGFEMPFDSNKPDSPGFGVHYTVDNMAKSFIKLRVFYYDGIGEESYGIDLSRKFMSSSTRYAGGISIRHMYRFEDLDTMDTPEPLKYNLQDYWLSRSFLLDPETVTRFIISARYTNNNVLDRPFIHPDSYHPLQKYRMYLGSLALTRQRFYKTNLVYGYGRTEDVPYGSLVKVTLGKELNEFKSRSYAGSEFSFGKSFQRFGYLHASAGFGSYLKGKETEQGILYIRTRYFSNLLPLGRNMIRNFVRLDFTRGFDRHLDEYLNYYRDDGFSGFRNDSVQGRQRINLGLETVVFSPVNVYGFRFAFFGFADISYLSGTNEILSKGTGLSGLGVGLRVRNDNLIFNTFQIRIGFFPDPPQYSRINNITVSGEQPLRMEDFESGSPSPIPFR